jgi:hypothetical protein
MARPGLTLEQAHLYDISRVGVGLVMARGLRQGTVVLLNLPGRRPGDTLTQSARVVHSALLPDGRWLVGCRLSRPLGDVELQENILRDDPKVGPRGPVPGAPGR